MKVVLDANIVISFLLTRGETISIIFDAWETEKFIILISNEIMAEFDEVIDRLIKRKMIPPEGAVALVRRLRKDSRKIKVTSKIDLSKDKKDNRYLAAALDGKADYLVSGDTKHLLTLKKIANTRIISPKEFADILQK